MDALGKKWQLKSAKHPSRHKIRSQKSLVAAPQRTVCCGWLAHPADKSAEETESMALANIPCQSQGPDKKAWALRT